MHTIYKFLSYLILMLLISWSVFQAQAITIEFADDVNILETISGDMYSAWGRVDIKAAIEGDLILAGGELFIDSDIWQDLIAAWWNITLSAPVWDDVRLAGWHIRIEADIAGDLIVFGWRVDISKWVTIAGDVVAYAWVFNLDGDIVGDLMLEAEEFILTWNITWNAHLGLEKFKNPITSWVIQWNLNYVSDQQIIALENTSRWITTFENESLYDDDSHNIQEIILWFIQVVLLWVFIFACLFYFFFENTWKALGKQLPNNILKNALYGFLFIIGIPVLIVILMLSVIWIPFALLIWILYIFIFVFLALINTLVLSAWLIDKYTIQAWYYKAAILLVIGSFLTLVSIVNIVIGLGVIWLLMTHICVKK